ncbi:MAG: hypothetical protein WCP20_08870, partial [Desulfuromonadales bacterium]
ALYEKLFLPSFKGQPSHYCCIASPYGISIWVHILLAKFLYAQPLHRALRDQMQLMNNRSIQLLLADKSAANHPETTVRRSPEIKGAEVDTSGSYRSKNAMPCLMLVVPATTRCFIPLLSWLSLHVWDRARYFLYAGRVLTLFIRGYCWMKPRTENADKCRYWVPQWMNFVSLTML